MNRPKSFYVALLLGGVFGFVLGMVTHQFLNQVLSITVIGAKTLPLFILSFVVAFGYLFSFLHDARKITRVGGGITIFLLTLAMLSTWNWRSQKFDFRANLPALIALERGSNCTGEGAISGLALNNKKFYDKNGVAVIAVKEVGQNNLELVILRTGVVVRGELILNEVAAGITSAPQSALGWIVCDR